MGIQQIGLQVGDIVRVINPACETYYTQGIVRKLERGKVVVLHSGGELWEYDDVELQVFMRADVQSRMFKWHKFGYPEVKIW